MPESVDPNIIEASPTKELFIYMLVRDIPLIRALIDLVDNSVDGAVRSVTNNNYNDFWIRIELDKDHFKISDNCGGIPIDIARNYAFRFGRPEGAEPTPGSIGKFGVGMKRTFFKLGKKFKVDSSTADSHFLVEVDVDEWKTDIKNWNFRFKVLEEGIAPAQIGTIIEITSLYENVSENFALENFQTKLIEEMKTAHSLIMAKGLNISLNGIPLSSKVFSLFSSDLLKPAFVEKVIDTGPSPVKVKIYAGVSERIKSEGGWYIFCNGRMVLEADQTSVTGWGEEDNLADIPKYHADFAYFRGYVFFDCDDAELLPWTTTKTGVDVDSRIFKAVKLEMMTLMSPILDFLRKLAKEKSQKETGEIEESQLEKALSSATLTKYSEIQVQGKFVEPEVVLLPAGPRMARIAYSKPVDDVEKIQQIVNVTSNKAVGEKTFEYFLKYEVNE